MISFAIHALEDVRIWLTDFGSCVVEFFIFSATPCLFSVMFGRMSFIAFGVSGDMRAILWQPLVTKANDYTASKSLK